MQVNLSPNEYFAMISILEAVRMAYLKGSKRALVTLPEDGQPAIASAIKKLRTERDKELGYTHA